MEDVSHVIKASIFPSREADAEDSSPASVSANGDDTAHHRKLTYVRVVSVVLMQWVMSIAAIPAAV